MILAKDEDFCRLGIVSGEKTKRFKEGRRLSGRIREELEKIRRRSGEKRRRCGVIHENCDCWHGNDNRSKR